MRKSIILTLAVASIAVAQAETKYPVSEPRITIPTHLWAALVLNDTYSDEFKGDKLNGDKWFDYHPTWKGRPPRLFEPKNVAVEDGKLVLSGGLRDEPHIITSGSGEIGLRHLVCCGNHQGREGSLWLL